ncbi:polysaccharide deacetylase family protein [Paenibacillus larvae]
MLLVTVPPGFEAERSYAIEILMQVCLGIPFRMKIEERPDVRISLQYGGDGELLVEDVLFGKYADAWLTKAVLPALPLPVCKLSYYRNVPDLSDTRELPVLYGNPLSSGLYIEEGEGISRIGIDVFGSAFFMLTRYEELIIAERDRRDRFASSFAVSVRAGLLGRPIVDEYAELLFVMMKRIWPSLKRGTQYYQVRLSHDVDFPFMAYGIPLRQIVKQIGGDLIRRGQPALALQRLESLFHTLRHRPEKDKGNTFDYLMDLSERSGKTSSFYFITDHTAGSIDGYYAISDPPIRQLMKRIHSRGHIIGLHPSYHTYLHPYQIKREYERLRQVCEEEKICQQIWGGRQHYLRWSAPATWQVWEDAGLQYDSTVGYADRPGFRCGICREYPVFNLQTRRKLKLKERPLLVMEQSLLNKSYLGMEEEKAFSHILRIASVCKRHNGQFTLLWHNSQLQRKEDRDLYERVLAAI